MALFFPPRMFTVDGNGLAMPGATLDFFITGTSTRQNTYSDSGLTTANANPVVADSNGLFGVIYLSTATDYKIVLKKSDGTTIFTVDPYFASQGTGRTAVNDVNYAAAITDRFIAYTAITATRTITLPSALTFPAGTRLVVVDESGSPTAGKLINVAPNGTDTINGSNTTQLAVNTAFGRAELESNGSNAWVWLARDGQCLSAQRSMLAGLGTAFNTTTKIDVAAGSCADSTNALVMTFLAGTIDFGTVGVNGLDAGALAANTSYHIFGISKVDGTSGFLASTSPTAPTMPSGYTLKRRVASAKSTAGSLINNYTQDGDWFQLLVPVGVNTGNNPGTTAILYNLSFVPSGVNFLANVQAVVQNAGVGTNVFFVATDPATTDYLPAIGQQDIPNSISLAGGVSVSAGHFLVRTNTSAQIRTRISFSDANVNFSVITVGWVDRRGKDA